MKLLYYDLETTGVEYWRNSIHQIAGIIEINGEVKETFDLKVKPHPKAIIKDEALEIAGVTKEQIMQYPEQIEVYGVIIKMLSNYVNRYNKQDKFYLVGFNNSAFDNKFFRAFFAQCNDKYFGSWFWSDSFDVMVLSSFLLRNRRRDMQNFKLHTVAKELGINVEEERLHDALYDIELTKMIFDKVI